MQGRQLSIPCVRKPEAEFPEYDKSREVRKSLASHNFVKDSDSIMAYHATNLEAIVIIQRHGDLQQASCLFLEAVKTIKDMLYVPPTTEDCGGQRLGANSCQTDLRVKNNKVKNSEVDNCHRKLVQEENVTVSGEVPSTPTSSHQSAPTSPGGASPSFVFQLEPLLVKSGHFSGDHLRLSPSSATSMLCGACGDGIDRIFTFAFATVPTILEDEIPDMKNKTNEDEWISYISSVLGAILFNAALTFHLRWIQNGRSSALLQALKFYRAARCVLQPNSCTTSGLDATSLRSNITDTNTRMVMLAVLNNLFSIHYELAESELVDKIRTEMRLTAQHIDPEISFANNEEAFELLCINAFFYKDNADMKIARAA